MISSLVGTFCSSDMLIGFYIKSLSRLCLFDLLD
jgi:hypothetical protein